MRITLATVDPDLGRLLVYQGFEDVYWAAALAYYGLSGLILLWIIGGKLFLLARRVAASANTWIEKTDAQILGMLVLITFLLSFVERVPELAIMSFIFWLYAGLVTNSHLRMRRKRVVR